MDSCTAVDGDDYDNVLNTQETTATITAIVSTDIASRSANDAAAYGDGTKATELFYALFDADNSNSFKLLRTNYGKTGDACFVNDVVTVRNLIANISLPLASGKKYTMVFWAQSPEATQYSFNPATAEIAIDSSKLRCNDDNQDAFYACQTFVFDAKAASLTVTLTRPFAQLNIGATDYADALAMGVEMSSSHLCVYNMPTKLNLIDGTTSDVVKYADYQYNSIPSSQANAGAFPAIADGEAVDAEYIAMAYVLVDKGKSLSDVEFDFTTDQIKSRGTDNVKEFHFVPMQRNSSANIYGDLFTAEVTWSVSINSGFDSETNVMQ
jgi:hypothetical protein